MSRIANLKRRLDRLQVQRPSHGVEPMLMQNGEVWSFIFHVTPTGLKQGIVVPNTDTIEAWCAKATQWRDEHGPSADKPDGTPEQTKH